MKTRPNQCDRGKLGELEQGETMPTEVGEEVAQEGAEEDHEPFTEKIPRSGDHKERIHVEAEHEEDVPNVFSEVERVVRCNLS